MKLPWSIKPDWWVECPECHGAKTVPSLFGGIIMHPCSRCNATGQQYKPQIETEDEFQERINGISYNGDK